MDRKKEFIKNNINRLDALTKEDINEIYEIMSFRFKKLQDRNKYDFMLENKTNMKVDEDGIAEFFKKSEELKNENNRKNKRTRKP